MGANRMSGSEINKMNSKVSEIRFIWGDLPEEEITGKIQRVSLLTHPPENHNVDMIIFFCFRSGS